MLLAACALMSGTCAMAQTRAEGFYKDFFMDCGIPLNTFDDLPAAKLLNLSMERICTWEGGKADRATEYEKQLMINVFAGSEIDENGILIYPDGAPRFKVIYVNGGKATAHGTFLTPKGLENIRTFYANGGSYIGTCAGAYLCSKGTYSTKSGKTNENDKYLGIWPGYVTGTGINGKYPDNTVEKKCPLLKYYDFGGDRYIDSVRHNGGCYMNTYEMPKGTEILMRFVTAWPGRDTLGHGVHKQVNCWAYKANEKSGRLVVTGSHPERGVNDERLQMFAAMFKYALEGQGVPQVKAALVDGEAREMLKSSQDNDPAYTKIGDKQYHHFTIDVPKGTKSVSVDLKSVPGYSNYDLFLYAANGEFAFNDVANWFDVRDGIDKTLVIDNPKAGKLYISVFCDTTVDVLDTRNGEQYTGRVDVLNGVPYIIKATLNK